MKIYVIIFMQNFQFYVGFNANDPYLFDIVNRMCTWNYNDIARLNVDIQTTTVHDEFGR